MHDDVAVLEAEASKIGEGGSHIRSTRILRKQHDVVVGMAKHTQPDSLRKRLGGHG